jgi:basic membrane protein A
MKTRNALRIFICISLLVSACNRLVVNQTKTQPTSTSLEEKYCLTVGAIYYGPIQDMGFNQSMHDGLMEMRKNIPCVNTIEAENTPDGEEVKRIFEVLIEYGAKVVFSNSFGHIEPSLELVKTYPDVIFEHSGVFGMSDHFGTFYAKTTEAFYILGIAAGRMTRTNQLGFVGGRTYNYTISNINAFELGAQSVNSKAQTIVQFTDSWVDKEKEIAVTNSLINQSIDVVTTDISSPINVLQTAEQRMVYSLGFQSTTAQQLASRWFITGFGFNWSKTMTEIVQDIISGNWKPAMIRGNLREGFMKIASFGPMVPEEVKQFVLKSIDDLVAGRLVVFNGPIYDQNGVMRIKPGDSIADTDIGNVDWFVKGIVNEPRQ